MAGISITLAGNFTKLDELKDKAQKTAGSIKNSFKAVTGSALFGGVAIAATAAFAGVTAAVARAIDKGGELNDMMLRTGASGKGLVILQKAFENAGLAASQVPQALNKMQKALAGVNEEGEPTNKAFQKLGLSIEELQKLDPVDAFRKTAQAIASIPDPARRAAAAMEIFGRAGGEMLAVMNDPGAYAQAREQVGSLAEMLPGVAGEFDTAGDAMASWTTKVEQLGTRIAITLLPSLERMTELMNSIDAGSFDWTDPFNADLKPVDKQAANQKAEDWASDDPMHGKSRTELQQAKLEAENAEFWARKEAERQASLKENAELAAKEAAAAKKAADQKKKESTTKANDAAAAKKAHEEESARRKEEQSKQEITDRLQGKISDVRARQEGHQFDSTIGAVSDMQRIGGGGGAVSSGLDYARQTADLQREANQLTRQLIELTRREVEV